MRRTRRAISIMLTAMLLGVAGSAGAQDERAALGADIETLQERLAAVAAGPGERLADRELERARAWIAQAGEARTRRKLGLARLLYNNAAMDLKVAEAKVEAFALTQERKQLTGQVEALRTTLDEAEAAEGVQP